MAPSLVMSVVVPGIPLVVTRRVLAHPRCDRLLSRVKKRVTVEVHFAGCVDERCSAELHVIAPVILFVEVRRSSGCSLANAFMKSTEPIRGARSLAKNSGERRISLREY